MNPTDSFAQLKFRDPERARGLRDALERLVRQADHAPVQPLRQPQGIARRSARMLRSVQADENGLDHDVAVARAREGSQGRAAATEPVRR